MTGVAAPAWPGPVVDAPSALRFQREIGHRASPEEMESIAAELEGKAAAVADLLSAGPGRLAPGALRQLLRWVFATRRRADEVVSSVGPGPLAAAITDLLRPDEPVAVRLDRFEVAFNWRAALGGRGAGFDLPAELLHFCSPDEYWLWTKWIWDPAPGTGALALVTSDDLEMAGAPTWGAVYLDVGRATALVQETGKAAGFTAAGAGRFGTDVFLASVYAVHMHTVLRLRMSREFTRVVPPLPQLVRRLLGVHHPEA